MSISRDLSDFGDWWLSELRGTIPARFRGDSRMRRFSDYEINVGRASVQILQRNADAIETSLPEFADSLGSVANSVAAPKRPVIEIVLEPGRYLERRLAPFRLPSRRARDMATFDLESATPLDPHDSLILFAEETNSRNDHRYFVVKKALLGPLIDAVESVSGSIAALKAHTDTGRIELKPGGYRQLLEHNRWQSVVRVLLAAGTASFLLGAIFTFFHVEWRYAEAIQQLDAKIDAVNADVKIVRTLSERRKLQAQQVESVRTQKSHAIPVVRIVEEMTRAVPDGSWLSDLSIKGEKVSATGVSQSAGGLIATLEASSLFTGPTFTAPVVKAPGIDGERFSVEMDLER